MSVREERESCGSEPQRWFAMWVCFDCTFPISQKQCVLRCLTRYYEVWIVKKWSKELCVARTMLVEFPFSKLPSTSFLTWHAPLGLDWLLPFGSISTAFLLGTSWRVPAMTVLLSCRGGWWQLVEVGSWPHMSEKTRRLSKISMAEIDVSEAEFFFGRCRKLKRILFSEILWI